MKAGLRWVYFADATLVPQFQVREMQIKSV